MNHALLAAGHSQRAIARRLGMGANTVARFARATTPEDLFRGQWQNRPTKLDKYKPHLHERWAEGCTNAWTLWHEIKEHGYTGGYGAVRAHLQPLRTQQQPAGAHPPSARTIASWMLTHPDGLPEHQRLQLKSAIAHCPELDALARHVRGFGRILTQLREGGRTSPAGSPLSASTICPACTPSPAAWNWTSKQSRPD